VTVVELAQVMGEYRRELLAQGFSPLEALQMVIAYQSNLMSGDLMERLHKKVGGQPWE
jgi:hypothetical protein